MKNIVILFILSSVLFCSSCIVTFENPVFDQTPATIDKRLPGKWKSIDKDEILFEFSTNSNSETILKLFEESGKTEKTVFSVSSAQIGKFSYLSLKILDEDSPNTFLIAKYEIAGDEMIVWLHSKEKIKELIQKGKLKGTQKNYGEISISNSSDELKKFLESTESDELFELLGKLKKQ